MKYVFIVVLIFASTYVHACRCKEANLESAFNGSESVVIGRVLAVAPLTDYDGNISIVEVVKSWKKPTNKIIAIISVTNCSFIFEKDRKYTLFLKHDRYGLYYTDKCMGSRSTDNVNKSIDFLNGLQ